MMALPATMPPATPAAVVSAEETATGALEHAGLIAGRVLWRRGAILRRRGILGLLRELWLRRRGGLAATEHIAEKAARLLWRRLRLGLGLHLHRRTPG